MVLNPRQNSYLLFLIVHHVFDIILFLEHSTLRISNSTFNIVCCTLQFQNFVHGMQLLLLFLLDIWLPTICIIRASFILTFKFANCISNRNAVQDKYRGLKLSLHSPPKWNDKRLLSRGCVGSKSPARERPLARWPTREMLQTQII